MPCQPGIRISLSGIPAKEGDTNLGAIPPLLFAISVSCRSICFSEHLINHLLCHLNHLRIYRTSITDIRGTVKHIKIIV